MMDLPWQIRIHEEQIPSKKRISSIPQGLMSSTSEVEKTRRPRFETTRIVNRSNNDITLYGPPGSRTDTIGRCRGTACEDVRIGKNQPRRRKYLCKGSEEISNEFTHTFRNVARFEMNMDFHSVFLFRSRKDMDRLVRNERRLARNALKSPIYLKAT